MWNNVLVNRFLFWAVYDRGCLSPVLFSLYIYGLIAHLKSFGYGIHVGSLFVGCVLYADDIVLVSASCQGLQQLINVCVKYGERWDIRFNPLKSHAVTVGGNNPSQHQITLNEKPVLWTNKVKYLGVYMKVIPVSVSNLTPVESFMGSLIALCLF